MNASERHSGEVQLATKLAYSVGASSDSIKTFSFGFFLLFFYNTVMGLPGTLVGLAVSLGLIWDSAVDPVIGHLSDRATIRLGRRHGFMLAGALCAGASFAAVFNPPAGLSTGPLFAWLMVSSLCLRSSNSLFMVPYYALGAELTGDYHERTAISGFRAAGAFAGTLLAAAAAFLVFFPSVTLGVDPKFAAGSYSSMGIALGIAITVAGLAATLGTLGERARLAASAAVPESRMPLRRALLATLQDRSFRILVVSSSLFFMAVAINAALAMHFLTYHARVAANEAITLYVVGFHGGALAGVLLWVHLAKRIEKHVIYAGATFVTALIISGGYWLVGEGRPFGTGESLPLVLGNAIAGVFGSAMLVVVPSMMADITAQNELHTGRRREGIFFGVYSFGQQVSAGAAVLVAGVLLDQFAGLVPARAAQSVATAERLAMLSCLLPALVLVAAGLIVLNYRLTRQRVEVIQRELGIPATRPHLPA